MSRKRPGFDILLTGDPDLEAADPEAAGLPADPAEAPGETPADHPAPRPAPRPATRPGPMAAAIAETAASLDARAATEAEIRAENDAIAHEHMRLARLGLVAEPVALRAIRADKLMRDRDPGEDADLGELMASIREIGLSNPIRLERAGEGFELIQGWRRLAAFRALFEETGDAARWGTIPALVSEPGETLATLYRRMVDENLVRRDVSFAELARLALDYAQDPASGVADAERAVGVLFRSARASKRSYIRAFLPVMAELGEALHHATEIPRALGLELSAALGARPELGAAIRAALSRHVPRSAGEEIAILRRMSRAARMPSPAMSPPRPAAATPATLATPSTPSTPGQPPDGLARLRLDLPQAAGTARAVVTPGRIEIVADRDFTTSDPDRLVRAIEALLADLDRDR